MGSSGDRRPRRRAGPDRWPEGPPRPGAPSRPDERRRGVPDRGPAGRRDVRARPAPLQEDGSGGSRAPAGGHGLPERDGVRPPEAPERHRRHGPRDRLRGGPRDPSAGRRPAAGHSRPSRAWPRGPRRRARAQVRDPRLPRLLLRRRGPGVPAGGRGEPPGQRSRLLSECRGSGGAAARDVGPVRAADRPRGHLPGLEGRPGGRGGRRGHRPRHGRLGGPEHERPHQGAAPRSRTRPGVTTSSATRRRTRRATGSTARSR